MSDPLQRLQVLFLWADFAAVGALAALLAWRERRDLLPGPSWAGAAAILVLGISLRLVFSPHAVIHENAHGYEYLGGAFRLDGYFFHGSGYYAFFHLVTLVAGREPEAVFAVNALVGALAAVMLQPIGRLLLDSREAGWIAALAQACIPPALRLGGSECMFPLATATALAATWAFLAAMRTGCAIRFALAACLLAWAVQVRPEMSLWCSTIALCATLLRGWLGRLGRSTPWISLTAFCGISLPWILFRLRDASENGLPGYVRLGPVEFAGSFLSSNNLILSPAWIPEILWPLAIAGLIGLALRRPRALIPLAGGFMALAWLVVGVDCGFATRMRLQTPLLPFLSLAAGAGAAWIASRLGPSRRFPALAMAGALIAVSSLARAPMAASLLNPQMEYRFLARTARPGPGSAIPEGCLVVTADRYMAGRVVCSEFPWWWQRSTTLSEFLADGERDRDGGCNVFYMGLSCQSFTYDESQSPLPGGIRQECSEVGEKYDLIPLAEETFPSRPDSYLVVTNPEVKLGFYRMVPRD